MVPGAEKPIALETQGLPVKNDPTQSEQLTTVCSDWVGSFVWLNVAKMLLRRNGGTICLQQSLNHRQLKKESWKKPPQNLKETETFITYRKNFQYPQ